MRKILWIGLSLVLALTAASCSRKPGPGSAQSRVETGPKLHLVIVAPGASDFWTIVEAGANQAARELGVDCQVRAPSTPGATEQKAILEDMLAKQVDGLAIAPIDPANQIDLINKACAQTNTICTDTDAAASKRLCYVGTNNYQAGTIAGKELRKALPNGGKVWVCVGMLDAQNAHDRNQGLLDAVKGTKIKVLGTMTDNADRAKAKANVEDALVKTPDIAAFVGLWSYNGPAIADAVQAAGKKGKVKIICFDEEDATLQAVKDGLVQATIVQRPFEFGYQSVKLLTAMARKQNPRIPADKVIDTGVQVITKSNVDTFWAQLKKATGRG